ncbi:regulatory protein SipA [Trichocoleus sp. DQ-U1]|uniref:regulatory protein SipA n=1 Tax=unclassified Trichocoleus TaxID=2628910 RepID=UPI003299686A
MSKEFVIGERVRVVTLPPYVKTAEPMPMLRPPDVIQLGEEGVVVDRRPGGYWSVRFARGVFLLDSQFIESVQAIADTESGTEATDVRSHNVSLEQKYIVDPS